MQYAGSQLFAWCANNLELTRLDVSNNPELRFRGMLLLLFPLPRQIFLHIIAVKGVPLNPLPTKRVLFPPIFRQQVPWVEVAMTYGVPFLQRIHSMLGSTRLASSISSRGACTLRRCACITQVSLPCMLLLCFCLCSRFNTSPDLNAHKIPALCQGKKQVKICVRLGL